MTVLGIDPGTANTGFGVVAQRGGRMVALDGGVIETSTSDTLEQRLLRIHAAVVELIELHSPESMSIEDIYFGRNSGSALSVGHARGVVMLAAAQVGIPCFAYTPQQIKGSVCGNGRADKDQVASMVQRLLALPEIPKPDHAADALAAAICHASQVTTIVEAAR